MYERCLYREATARIQHGQGSAVVLLGNAGIQTSPTLHAFALTT